MKNRVRKKQLIWKRRHAFYLDIIGQHTHALSLHPPAPYKVQHIAALVGHSEQLRAVLEFSTNLGRAPNTTPDP